MRGGEGLGIRLELRLGTRDKVKGLGLRLGARDKAIGARDIG